MRLVGRIAFPIFLFLVGFNGKYIWRWDLLGRAIVVQIPIFVLSHWFGFGSMALNILFGIIIGRGVLSLVQKFPLSFRNFRITSFAPYSTGYIFIAIFTMMLIIIHPWLAQFLDYGSFVILLPLIGYLIQNVKNRQIPPTPLYQGGRIKYLLIFLYSIVVLVFLFKFTWEVFGFSLPQLYVLGVFFVLLLCIFFVL
ncbi:conjugal transfer protein TraX [Patescibacteria group bacterium]|nr:conjugal transfer protein TraX [Patescibacteria group bacterium]MBU1758224.1 conjugal transfer protein TraX [Patescibacteria group bacterium]